MPKKAIVITPQTRKHLEKMGTQIKLARLRRDLSMESIAESAGVSLTTLWQIEKGAPSVSMGAYAAVLCTLGGMDKDLLLVAKDDILGRAMQDQNLRRAKRGRKSIQ